MRARGFGVRVRAHYGKEWCILGDRIGILLLKGSEYKFGAASGG